MTEKMNGKSVKLLAMLGLITVTVIWGATFVVMKNSLDTVKPTYIVAYRFTIAALGMLILFHRSVKTMTVNDLKYGTVLGFLLFISYYFQTYGLAYTTASKNAFITTLYVIIVPFLHWLMNRIRPTRYNLAASVIAVAGLALVSLKGDLTVNLGDILTFICSFCFALHMIYIDRYTVCYDPVKLTVVQMGTMAGFAWIVALLFEGPCDLSVFSDPGVVLTFLYMGIVAGMFCFLVQTVGQKYLSPNISSILLSFESVFGLIFSVIFLGEEMTVRMLIGCALMFSAAILSEYTPQAKKKEEAFKRLSEKTENTGTKGN